MTSRLLVVGRKLASSSKSSIVPLFRRNLHLSARKKGGGGPGYEGAGYRVGAPVHPSAIFLINCYGTVFWALLFWNIYRRHSIIHVGRTIDHQRWTDEDLGINKEEI